MHDSEWEQQEHFFLGAHLSRTILRDHILSSFGRQMRAHTQQQQQQQQQQTKIIFVRFHTHPEKKMGEKKACH